ncbi:hypothetical protein M8756_02685 [Lutimaribacter sp. EGI FJ00015]|uniref:Uncharacterized protein n=1 Tax=Lutimaribacter degradans TaxID=2945989 RepID=A0ACC5ZSD1_9RHOB|nr:hypothetical protein [Lutimaribacter sp. EGI FJ00013]MCM2560853.1 hypothetical protein [Lutimaribacter sp. EGI FJ00013]MCO0612202.1 hypothetical protein [Lutimaribacter sp. EGI FJ00015]MCO0634678.1 hypothetical protein [Lutimaribacter sp. EGI FJ00014]
MTVQIAHLYATLCLGAVFFQVALIAGLPLGEWTQGGRHPGVLPWRARALAALSIRVLVCMALAVVSAAGFAGGFWPRWTGWAAVLVTAALCALNWVSRTAPERAVWGPVNSIMLALATYVMVVGG